MCPFSSNLVHLPSSNFDSKDLQAAPSRRCRFEFSNVDLCACFSCFPQEVIRCLLLLGLLEVEHPVCFYSFVQGIVDNYRAAEEQFVDLDNAQLSYCIKSWVEGEGSLVRKMLGMISYIGV